MTSASFDTQEWHTTLKSSLTQPKSWSTCPPGGCVVRVPSATPWDRPLARVPRGSKFGLRWVGRHRTLAVGGRTCPRALIKNRAFAAVSPLRSAWLHDRGHYPTTLPAGGTDRSGSGAAGGRSSSASRDFPRACADSPDRSPSGRRRRTCRCRAIWPPWLKPPRGSDSPRPSRATAP